MSRLILLALFCLRLAAADSPVYVVLWFDTEDYIQPASDDAALRIARDLERLGVRATFKVVGEKARVLEKRGRNDVIQALSFHDIGYHSNFHSVQPTPAVYLKDMGWREGAAEFERREQAGVNDLRRIFGIVPSCYGQPGSSWGPQSFPALLRLGIPVYLDEGSQVGIADQPFWFGGMLNVFHMGRFLLRPSLDEPDRLPEWLQKFDRAADELRSHGGGVISTYYHPTEFVTTEFWDAANFSHGANPARGEWRLPEMRTKEDIEKRFLVLLRYVQHAKATRNVRFVTARELPQLYRSRQPAAIDRARIAAHMAARQTFLTVDGDSLSAADMLLVLLGLKPGYVEGPSQVGHSAYAAAAIPRAAFAVAKADAAAYVRRHHALPAEVWIGSQSLALGDFAATLAGDDGQSAAVTVRRGNPEMEKYIATDPSRPFNWVIHPEGFQAGHLLDLARLAAWTLKPAVLR